MSVEPLQDTTIALRVLRNEPSWRGWDQALADLENLAKSITQPAGLDITDVDSATIVLEINSEIVAHLAGMFEVHRVLLRYARNDYGDDHPQTEDAVNGLLLAFAELWVWKHACDAAIIAVEEALELDEHPGFAAVNAVTLTIHDGWPEMLIWLAAKAPSETLKTDVLVRLAARLRIGRRAGDTGLRLHPSRKRALLADAAERGSSLESVLREELPGAIFCAIGESDDLPNLRTLRARALRLAAPRNEPPRGPDMSLEVFLERTFQDLADADARSTDQVVLDGLAVHEIMTALDARAQTLPRRSRQILEILRLRWATNQDPPNSTEIGDLLDIKPSTVRVTLRQLRNQLTTLRDGLAFDASHST